MASSCHVSSTAQVVVLGSYSNVLPGQDPTSGPALPRYRVSDESAFGSMPDIEWQQLEVRPVLALILLASHALLHCRRIQKLLYTVRMTSEDA